MTVKPGEDPAVLKVGIIVNDARSITSQLAQGLHCERRMIQICAKSVTYLIAQRTLGLVD